MPIRSRRLHTIQLAFFVISICVLAGAQTKPPAPNSARQGSEYSGMYSFMSEGEYVQLTVQDHGQVIGLISRYADPSGNGEFVNNLFKSGQLDGNHLEFTTKIERGISFEFRGTIERGEGKTRDDEAYYLLKGTLVETTTDAAKKNSSQSHEVEFKSFPRNLAAPPTEKQ